MKPYNNNSNNNNIAKKKSRIDTVHKNVKSRVPRQTKTKNKKITFFFFFSSSHSDRLISNNVFFLLVFTIIIYIVRYILRLQSFVLRLVVVRTPSPWPSAHCTAIYNNNNKYIILYYCECVCECVYGRRAMCERTGTVDDEKTTE